MDEPSNENNRSFLAIFEDTATVGVAFETVTSTRVSEKSHGGLPGP